MHYLALAFASASASSLSWSMISTSTPRGRLVTYATPPQTSITTLAFFFAIMNRRGGLKPRPLPCQNFRLSERHTLKNILRKARGRAQYPEKGLGLCAFIHFASVGAARKGMKSARAVWTLFDAS